MLRYLPLLAASLSLSPSLAHAQGAGGDGHRGSLQQQRACRPDILRLCRDLPAQDDEAMANCLKANADKLSPACRQALGGAGDK
jgi:hypothetical protein